MRTEGLSSNTVRQFNQKTRLNSIHSSIKNRTVCELSIKNRTVFELRLNIIELSLNRLSNSNYKILKGNSITRTTCMWDIRDKNPKGSVACSAGANLRFDRPRTLSFGILQASGLTGQRAAPFGNPFASFACMRGPTALENWQVD